jgi:hypothetical protein
MIAQIGKSTQPAIAIGIDTGIDTGIDDGRAAGLYIT